MTINEKTQRPLVIDPTLAFNVKKGGLWLNIKPIN